MGLSKKFWAKAVNTAVYLINRGPSQALVLGISEEACTCMEASLKHLRVFGSTCYAMVNSGDCTKLDPKLRKYKFVRYMSDEFGYKCYDHAARRIIISRDVIFNEDVLYKDLQKSIMKNVTKNKEIYGEVLWPIDQNMQPKDEKLHMFDVLETEQTVVEQSEPENEESLQPTSSLSPLQTLAGWKSHDLTNPI